MMFYHILVENNEKDTNGNNKQYYELDMQDKTKLLDKFAIPYLKEQTLRINGYKINDACRFVVTKSDLNTKIIVESVKKDPGTDPWEALFYSREKASKDNQYTQDITDDILEEAQNLLSTAVLEPKKEQPISSNKIFIVHGRDHNLLTQVENALMKLGLDPIVLQEQANNGKTIIEKIEECTDVGFGIVLYTPCDEGRLKLEDGELKPRARQNVVLEHGYLMGKLGRERVCCLVSDDVEFPSDIQGVVYTSAKNVGQWKYDLAKELKAAGFDIDMNKL